MSFGQAMLTVLIMLLQLYIWVILASAILSWGFLPPTNKVVRILRLITEPVLKPLRLLLLRVLPVQWRRIDFSPVLALILIQVLIFILRIVPG